MSDTSRIVKFIAFLKVFLLFACCWPLRPTATKCQRTCNKIFIFLSVVHSLLMAVTMIYTIINGRANMFLVFKLSCEFFTVIEVPLQIFCYVIKYDQLQDVTYELEDYCKRAKSEELIVFDRYIEHCKSVYIGIVCTITFMSTSYVIGPLFHPHPFPLEVEYPFDVSYQPLKTIIYLHHVINLYQNYTQICSNVYVALLLWFVSARCDILSDRFREVTTIKELRACMKEHQEILGYGKKVSLAIRFVMLMSITVSTMILITAGCIFLSRQPLPVKLMFVIFFNGSLGKVFLCTWPADHLLSTSMNIPHAAYDSMWYNKKAIFQKNFVHIISRGQHAISISIPSMLPTISLNYYASYVSTAFSYLTTLRVLLEDDI